MATLYQTPGVYVEEIPKFPPSVAQVETAIPAFIGFTDIADDIAPRDLNLKPKRIGSMVEFEQFYGYGPSPNIDEVNIDESNNFRSAKVSSSYFLYDSMRLFFANGGGDCYIVSIGDYSTDPDVDVFKKGIDALLKEDDPTMLLFPDAAVMDEDSLGAVQQHALAHCALDERKDRFAILDLREDDALGTSFRSKIGINFLSYGAAYTPWLKTKLPKNVNYPDVKSVIKRNGASITPAGLTDNIEITDKITELEKAYDDKDRIIARTKTLSTPSATLIDRFQKLEADYNDNKDIAKFQPVVGFIVSIFKKFDDYLDAVTPHADLIKNTELNTAVTAAIPTFKTLFTEVIKIDKETKAKFGADYATQAKQADFTDAIWGAGFIGPIPESTIMNSTNADPALKKIENMNLAINALRNQFDSINRAYLTLVANAAATNAETQDTALELSFPVYKSILRGVATYKSNMPPSGAIAGVYAMVDRTRGVWKAPANVGLSEVVEPVTTFTKTQLDRLNVDTTAGKSINAIRTFFGEGVKVYGARTLAGNDNEWRYINVRRFFIMAEESSKKASERFVFEPNDANTWVKVQGMIENFLTTLWRQGALQGAKPEHAFYVAVGFGKTMTALDILEGRMIVEIGMAVVRPAEFIILRFSHKMAES
jgi:phage tail sheath protein FI